ncbi:MAG: alpha-galactosidase [Treponema sp.]|nr:alpha-galactosidase [Treponema sp.]
MNKTLYSQFTFGDLHVRYILEESGRMNLLLVPTSKIADICEFKESRGDSLVQAKLIGDVYAGGYAGGLTMRNSGTVENLRFITQETHNVTETSTNRKNRTEIITKFEDTQNHLYIHTLGYTDGDLAVDSKTSFINNDSKKASLEFISSFSLSEITPFEKGLAPNCLDIYRIRSKWSDEAWLVKESAEELQLEPSWANWPPNAVRYGQIGSLPVKHYAPFGAVEDKRAGVIWAASLAIESSWEMEFYRRDHGLAFSGGLAGREFGHWVKNIAPGKSFTSPTAILTVTTEGIDKACQRLTQYNKKFLLANPASEDKLPILFNEYCTTWGNPSEENIINILDAIDGHGMEYFIVDCGWFKEDGKDWSNSMGDYIPSTSLFPKGLSHISNLIHQRNMKAGIWFEIDNVGKFASAYNKEDFLLKRDGIILTTQNRRFFDMRKPEVQDYLTEKVIAQIKKHNFDYIKIDYNDTYGIGCDGAESLGEGLRAEREASLNFIRKMRKEIPNLIIENCASGGHKTEPLMMSLSSMASFSDAHECENIPVIAAGLHRTILPQQNQIWVVIREQDSLQRLAYSIAAGFLGRICFSGDVTKLTAEQWRKIDEGIAFYKEIVPIIKDGYSYLYENRGPSARLLEGYQAVFRAGEKGAYLTAHIFNKPPKKIEIALPHDFRALKEIKKTYRGSNIFANIQDGILTIVPSSSMESISLIME